MGSSKRHKTDKTRDLKRKRHRSRSRSYSSAERDRADKHRHHKKHKKKDRKDYDSDVEIISAPPPPKISRSTKLPTPPPPEITRHSKRSPTPPSSNQSHSSLSIEETNKIRAKLGLKPLEVNNTPAPKESDKAVTDNIIKDDLGEFYHKPAVNTAEKARTEKIKEKLALFKEKRKIESALSSIKTLGESDSDDDVSEWVKKSRRMEEEKKKAQERAKMLDQMDEEFGIGDLVNEDVKEQRRKAYTERDLRGMRVEHNLDNFDETVTILTLKDQPVLAEDKDTLINVNMIDNERYAKNVLTKSKKPGYDAYDEDNFDEYGLPKKQILQKYDEEIHGEKRQDFAIGFVDPKAIKEKQQQLLKERLANKRIESLEMPELKIAQDYYNEEEMTKFKKPKKKIRKIRKNKILKADDIVPDNSDYLRDLGCRRRRRDDPSTNHVLDTMDIELPSGDLSGIKIEDDVDIDRKIRQKTQKLKKPVSSMIKPEDIAMSIKKEHNSENKDSRSSITLNSMAEFCRTLGDIPTYGQAGNREDNPNFMDYETEIKEESMDEDNEVEERGVWNSVKIDEEEVKKVPVTKEAAILDEEPSLDKGVGGALKLAMSKGYLQKEDSNRPSASRFAHLKAQNYSIEDKTYGDDDKFGSRRDRFNGPTMDFKEKDTYKPNVKLDYIDDDGHILNPKEAFRYLSHKFHGKGPGKNKVEKRMKKAEQEILMKRMSSTDTPLGTLTLLQAKQKDTQSPFIVLSGSKHQIQTTTISKSKN